MGLEPPNCKRIVILTSPKRLPELKGVSTMRPFAEEMPKQYRMILASTALVIPPLSFDNIAYQSKLSHACQSCLDRIVVASRTLV